MAFQLPSVAILLVTAQVVRIFGRGSEARVYAWALPKQDFVRDYAEPETLSEKFAVAKLFHFPVDPLIRDLVRLPPSDVRYRATVRALSMNADLTSLAKIRPLWNTPGMEMKRRDISTIRMGIQYQEKLLFAKTDGLRDTPNARTWWDRGIETVNRIVARVKAYRLEHPSEPIYIFDGAISSGVMTLQLARRLADVPDVHITGFDISLNYTIVDGLTPDYRLVFDSFGRLVQAVPTDSRGRFWTRWTLALYLPESQAFNEAMLMTIGGILIGDDRCPLPSIKEIESTFQTLSSRSSAAGIQVTSIDFVDPEVRAFADEHPDRLSLVQADVFNPPHPPGIGSRYLEGRLMGLFSRDKERYFSFGQIKRGIDALAGTMLDGGHLQVGIDQTRHHKELLLDEYRIIAGVPTLVHTTYKPDIHVTDTDSGPGANSTASGAAASAGAPPAPSAPVERRAISPAFNRLFQRAA